MFRTFRLLVLTAGLSALTVTPGHAVPIVDQSFTSPSNLATVINECCRFIGQTFTAGLTGTLTGVNIDVGPARSDSVLPLLVAIRTVTGSFPSSTVLSSTTLARGGATLSELIVFHRRSSPRRLPPRRGRRDGSTGSGSWEMSRRIRQI